MSLRATLAKATTAAFNALGDIPESCTYRRTSSAYNPATGTNVVTNTDTTISKGIFTKFDNYEVDRVSVLASDVKFIVRKSELAAIVPNLSTDKLIRTADSKTYNIIRVTQDPAGVTYTLQLRAPA